MIPNEILIIDLLQFVGGGLPDIIRRDSHVNSDPLRNVIIVVVNRFLRGIVDVFLGINLNPHPFADSFFPVDPVLSFLLINHGAYRLFESCLREASSPAGRTLRRADPPCNKRKG